MKTSPVSYLKTDPHNIMTSVRMVQGTTWDVVVQAPPSLTRKQGPVCMWCGGIFARMPIGGNDCIEAKYHTEDGTTDWDGEYIHRFCDYKRYDATLRTD